jgi:hypothetical protein
LFWVTGRTAASVLRAPHPRPAGCPFSFSFPDLSDRRRATASELLDVLVTFDASREAERQACAKIAVCWIEWAGADFAPREIEKEMVTFVEGMVSETLSLILQSIVEGERKRLRVFGEEFPSELVYVEDRTKVQTCVAQLISYSPVEVGDAIVALDRELLASLTATNYNSTVFPTHFNKLSFGVVSFVLCCPTLEQQHAVLRAMVEVAARLYDMHDYNGLYAIVSGLSAHDLERVPTLLPMASLSASHRLTLNQLKQLCSPEDNYSGLRSMQLTDLAEGAPVVPFFPTYLRDLVALSESNDDYIAVGKELARLLEFKENIAKVASETPESTPEHQIVQSSLRKLLLDLPVASEESRNILSDIWKKTVVKPKSSSKRGSQMLGKTLLADKGVRLRALSKRGHESPPSTAPQTPKPAKHSGEPLDSRVPKLTHVPSDERRLKPQQSSGESLDSASPKVVTPRSVTPRSVSRIRTESEAKAAAKVEGRRSLFQSMPSVPMAGSSGDTPPRSSSTSNIPDEEEGGRPSPGSVIPKSVSFGNLAWPAPGSLPKSESVSSFVESPSPRRDKDKEKCIIC